MKHLWIWSRHLNLKRHKETQWSWVTYAVAQTDLPGLPPCKKLWYFFLGFLSLCWGLDILEQSLGALVFFVFMSSGSLTGFSTEDDLNFHAFFFQRANCYYCSFEWWLCQQRADWQLASSLWRTDVVVFQPKNKALNSKHGYGMCLVIDMQC